MGNFEKLVVLIVLFLSAVVLAVSLRQGDGEVEASGPLDAAQARLQEPTETSPPADPEARSERGPTEVEEDAAGETPRAPGYLLDAGLGNEEAEVEAPSEVPVEDPRRSAASQAPVTETAPGSPPRILRTTRGLQPSALEDFMVYTLEQGDTWSALAERFYRDARHAAALRLANEDLSVLVAGTPILVPVYDLTQEAGVRAPLAPAGLEAAPPDAVRTAQVEPPVDERALREASSYQVVSGDSLSGISLKVYGAASKWKAIFEANRDRMESPDWLQVGMRLRIPRALELEELLAKPEPEGPKGRPRVR